MAVDPTHLRSSPRTTYHLSFFLLRVPLLTIDDQPAQITSDDGRFTIGCRDPPFSITFDSLTTEIDTVVKKYGLEGVGNYWCEDVPLFELKLSGQDGLEKFLHSEEKVQNELAFRIAAMLAQQQKSPNPVVVYAHTEVFMLTPRPESKDAHIVRVSSENLATCTTIWRESEVFNFGALFHAFGKGIFNQGEVTLAQLNLELQEVSEWFSLGLYLGIPEAELTSIKHEPTLRSLQQFRTEMLTVWMRRLPVPSWSRVVKALMEIGRETLAHKIALKYGVPDPVPATVEDIPDQTMPLQKILSTQVEKLKQEVKAKDRKLAVRNRSLMNARRQKCAVNQRLTQIKQTIRRTEIQKMELIGEKMKIEKQLQLKEQELLFLHTSHQKHTEQLQKVIKNKEEEVQQLQKDLCIVKNKLTSEKKLAQDLKEKLQQTTVELAEKSVLVQEQEKANKDLRTQLERERQHADYLRMQATSANTSKDQYTREIENQLSIARCECENNAKEIEEYKLSISKRKMEVEALSRQLQEREDVISRLEQESAAATARDGGMKRELELEEHILEMTIEAAGLKDKLDEIEEWRQRAVREMEAAQVESKLLQNWVAELRGQTAFKACQLQLPLKLEWKLHEDLPFAMSLPHSVVVEGDVYVGGGDTGKDEDARTVMVYEQGRRWKTLPRYRYMWFGMVVLQDQLMLVGGCDTYTYKATNQISVWNSLQWTYPYPPMPTCRHSPAVATYNKWLVVAGGSDGRSLMTVEIMDATNKQWFSAYPLPVGCSQMTSAVVEDECCFMGGFSEHSTPTKQVYHVSIPTITSQAVFQYTSSTATAAQLQWHTLTKTPLDRSAALVLCGSLLAIGGYHSSAIHLYQPGSETWVEVGNLPIARSHCSCTLLPSGEILVAGGRDDNGRTSRVDVASLL